MGTSRNADSRSSDRPALNLSTALHCIRIADRARSTARQLPRLAHVGRGFKGVA